MNYFTVDGTVENLAFLSVEYITFGQIELATRCTSWIQRWIKQREVLRPIQQCVWGCCSFASEAALCMM